MEGSTITADSVLLEPIRRSSLRGLTITLSLSPPISEGGSRCWDQAETGWDIPAPVGLHVSGGDRLCLTNASSTMKTMWRRECFREKEGRAGGARGWPGGLQEGVALSRACGKGARTAGQRLCSGHQLSRPEWLQDSGQRRPSQQAGRGGLGTTGRPGLLKVVGLGRF